MPDHVPNETLDRDRPIGDPKHDRLGFSEIAKHLADAFTQNDLSEGFVVGVEGAWGSGKSSLVGMAFEHLKQRNTPPGVVEFQPWLVGSSQELLTELFSLLAEELKRRDPTAGATTSEILKRFAAISTGLGTLAEWVGKAGVPGAALAGEAFKQVGGGAAGLATSSLADLKKALVENLAKLTSPIIVFIDDLDRLDPSEAVEVLRLVRAVADFPNVAYILAYDPEVLAHNLERALQIKDGRAYLEKIVQASFRVPMPMNYDLMNWFREDVGKLFPSQQSALDPDDRIATALHRWSPVFLETPRDVVRALNALRLYGMPVVDKIDVADMVFLQMVRLKMPELYEWIEGYAADLAAVGDWGFLKHDGGDRAGATLLQALKTRLNHHNDIMHGISDHLPGVPFLDAGRDGKDYKVRYDSNKNDYEKAINQHRLTSPHHFRYYFAFSEPDGIISDSALSAFLSEVDTNKGAATAKLQSWVHMVRPQGGKMGAVLLDRIARIDQPPKDKIEALLDVLSPAMDGMAREPAGFLQTEPLRGSKYGPFGIIRFLDPDVRIKFLEKFFYECPSLAWLTGIIRTSIFDHGYYGDHVKPVDERLLTIDEFNTVRLAYLQRLRNEKDENILAAPRLASLLFGWLQADGKDNPLCEAKAWVASQCHSNEGFIAILEFLQGKNTSVDTVTYVLGTETLKAFFDSTEMIQSRLIEITNSSPELAERSTRLSAAIEAAKLF